MKAGKILQIVYFSIFFFIFIFFGLLNCSHQGVVQAAGSLWDMQSETIGAGTNVPKAFGEKGGSVTDFRIIILYVVKLFFTFLGIICVAIVLYAGFKWMNSQGDSGEVDAAKKYILRAVIGLLVILSSIVLTDFALRAVQGVVDEEKMFWLF